MENLDELLYWSPAVRWRTIDGCLKIEKLNYGRDFTSLFPDFYFLTQQGITEKDIKDNFRFDEKLLDSFIKDLMKRRILVTGPLKVHELFFIQDRLYNNPYGEKITYNAEALESFKAEQLSREIIKTSFESIELKECAYPEDVVKRKTHRVFEEREKISFKQLSKVLGVYRQRNEDGRIKYFYPSAGGLYPIDIYLYVKYERVEGLKKGIYYYNPRKNTLELINDNVFINEDAHFFTNQDIFRSSAMSIFYIYNADVTMPKYSGMGYFYAGIDTGIMVEKITQIAEHENLGVCSIGDMNFDLIEKYFSLKKNQYHLHTLEMGLKSKT